jgi:alkane 1-monooxygenase
MQMLPYFFSYFVAVLAYWGISQGAWYNFVGFVIIFICHPILENTLFKNIKIKSVPGPRLGTFILLLALPFVTLLTLHGLHHFSIQQSWYFNLGIILSVGSLNGILAINTAHELVHRREKNLRFCGNYLLWIVQFMHWGLEHVYGHHKNVGTVKDPATARKNENLYAFWIRNYFTGFASAAKIAHEQSGKNILKNKVFYFQILQGLLLYIVYLNFGFIGLIYWVLQALVAIILLLTVDYNEHYGLLREQRADGSYEPVLPKHSWDSYLPLTNWALANLGYHSFHHLKAVVPYYDLKEIDHARKLPYGYSAMVIMAFIPPLYKKIMNDVIDLK